MDLSLRSGERQVAYDLNSIRYDHRARYHWARETLPEASMVIDIGCGIGYGTHILASGPHVCVGMDHSAETIKFALRHWHHEDAAFQHGGVDGLAEHIDDAFDAAVCFEVIEHLADPLPMLRQTRRVAKTLLASVPNETVFPWKNYAFHHRHYTKAQFEELLNAAGWRVTEWWGQTGPESDVEWDCEGRTLIAVCERGEELFFNVLDTLSPPPEPDRPEHIAIVAFGPTSAYYLDAAKKEGNRKRFADFVIGVNAMGSVINCDLVMHMDDVRIQERRATADPEGHVAGIVEWLREYPGRVMTSRAHQDYPNLEEFPLEDLLNKFGGGYINGTGAAALAYAIYLEPKEISLWGFDFTYPNAHKNEKGRACVEYWLGRAQERGIAIRLPPKTSLMDSYEDSASDEAHIYGYDTVKLQIAFDPTIEKFRVTKTPLPESEWPTAEEVEAAYDHGKHPADQGRARK